MGLGEALVHLVLGRAGGRHVSQAPLRRGHGNLRRIFDVGHASGPILGGLLVAAFDFRLAFAALAVVLVAAIPVFLAGVNLDETPERPAGA